MYCVWLCIWIYSSCYTALKFNLTVFDFRNSTNKIHLMMFERKLETMCYI
jgi:hypothetical protein